METKEYARKYYAGVFPDREAEWMPTGKTLWTTNRGTVEEWQLRTKSGEILNTEWRLANVALGL